ncbi:WD-40 repeat-containing protein [Calothrix sp. NIES-4071]|nr:WD-40 repeat-containing protein [Calothrix sp. NIES-4071]BAZ64198.1 WD-40 repeat-containing protein [Calothrix sp. NIES-4105]
MPDKKEIGAHLEISPALEELAWTLSASQDEFRLILARCNYVLLRSVLYKHLQKLTNTKIPVLSLRKTENSLYKKIETLLPKQPKAIMVWGLEYVSNLDQLIIATNLIREEFRKNFNFPIVLWVNDEVLGKMMRLSSDFESWATTIEFTITTDELIKQLKRDTNAIFEVALASDTYSIGWQIGYIRRNEIIRYHHDLQLIQYHLQPSLKASVDFVRGQQAYLNNQIDTALDYLQRSLIYWRQEKTLFNKMRAGILFFHIGLCYYQKSENITNSQEYLKQARNFFEQCIDIFTQANHLNLVAKFINPLGETLKRLEAWDDLQRLALNALDLQKLYGNSTRVARVYGFLAEVALSKRLWKKAKQDAYQALHYSTKDSAAQYQGLYLLLLASSELKLGQTLRAIKHLLQARSLGNKDNPTQYIQILQLLKAVYWKQNRYLEAYKCKLEIRSTEQQYGFRAFIGAGKIQAQRKPQSSLTQIIDAVDNKSLEETLAPEITASGRGRDIKQLLERIMRPDHKLIVIHGYSGVGKTSLLQAGLIPALKRTSIKTNINITTVYMRFYDCWVDELDNALAFVLLTKIHKKAEKVTPDKLLQILKDSLSYNFKFVLIFDQFEEFLFKYNTYQQRYEFFHFLGECLNLLGVKVILSLRKDYLHYLLECIRIPSMNIISYDVLSKNVLYEIGNFSTNDAKTLIGRLSERSKHHLELDLIERLVDDLAIKFGEVRPIELQIVCAQLETENITTSLQYQQRGPKQELVKRYLQEVIQDCGQENQKIAEILLYLLTDEKAIRPAKTHSELKQAFMLRIIDNNWKQASIDDSRLDIVLNIFVAAGIVVLIPANPDDRYQLVHDYLATFIQKQQRPKVNDLILKLQQLETQIKVYKWVLFTEFAIIVLLAILIH